MGFSLSFNVQKATIEVLCREVNRLGGKVSDNVDSIASPEGEISLFLNATAKTVGNAIVLLFEFEVLMLGLKKKLHPFDRSH